MEVRHGALAGNEHGRQADSGACGDSAQGGVRDIAVALALRGTGRILADTAVALLPGLEDALVGTRLLVLLCPQDLAADVLGVEGPTFGGIADLALLTV